MSRSAADFYKLLTYSFLSSNVCVLVVLCVVVVFCFSFAGFVGVFCLFPLTEKPFSLFNGKIRVIFPCMRRFLYFWIAFVPSPV